MTWICEDCGRRVDDSVQSHKEHRDTCKAQGGGMNAIEAVARAIDPGAWQAGRVGDGARRDMALVKARAALTALRDNGVTAKMFLAWNDAHGPADEFRAMLDAALSEP